jgi:predicted phage baseplate assembly protein
MALETVRLDDLTWSEMVLAIRRRIAADSDGQWTLHAPVDPGVTLLELFAWLLEQRVYWMDQVPDTFVRAALTLLGENMQPTQSAATVLQFSPSAFEVVPAMTRMRLLKRQPALTFSTEQTLTLVPVKRIGLQIAGQDRSADLEQGRVIRLFSSDGSPEEITIMLWLQGPMPATAPEAPLTLLFEMRTATQIKPQWNPEAVSNVPPAAPLSWWYRSPSGRAPVQFAQVDDGTGGLRRSGIVRLSLPSDWQAEGPADVHTGLIPYALLVRVAQATFTVPPRLQRLLPNVAIARHQYPTKLSRRVQWLPLPGNTIALEETDSPPLETSMHVSIKERGDLWQDWKYTQDLSFHGPADRVFLVDRQAGMVRFGDGLTGRLPVPGALGEVEVRYQVGGGNSGNLGSNLSWEGVENPNVTAKNIVLANGGKEAETPAAARQRVAGALRQQQRAITRADYEELALTTPGVAIKRAYAAVGFHPAHPCTKVPGAVTVFVVPDAPREAGNDEWVESAFVAAPVVDPGALHAVRKRLETARLVTSEVFVCNPRYRPVALTVTVEGEPVDTSRIRTQITERLQHFLDPLSGGDTQQGWPFGEPLRPSVLVREAQRALGEAGTVVSVAIKLLDTAESAQDCFDVRIGEHDIVTLREVNVQLRRATADRPNQGGLR